eukprot:2244435-Prymnesium_polylepis.1
MGTSWSDARGEGSNQGSEAGCGGGMRRREAAAGGGGCAAGDHLDCKRLDRVDSHEPRVGSEAAIAVVPRLCQAEALCDRVAVSIVVRLPDMAERSLANL